MPNKVKFELADELVEAIAPDILRCLRRDEFFVKLDTLLCPENKKARPKKCMGDFALSQQVLKACGYDSLERTEIVAVLKSRGGCCDCEVLYNVAEKSRLKAKYWRTQFRSLRTRSTKSAAVRGRGHPRHTA